MRSIAARWRGRLGWAGLVAVAACVWVMLVGGTGWAAESTDCDRQGLRAADVSVRLEIRRRGFDDWIATSTTTVEVPRTWGRAKDLLWDEQKGGYLEAMRCLFGPTDADEQHRSPTVIVRGEKLVVKDVVRITAREPYPRRSLGLWKLELDVRQWSFSLVPGALSDAQWSSVTVVSEVPVKETNSMPSYRDAAGTLTWTRWIEPDQTTLRQVEVWVEPPGQMALAWGLNYQWRWLVPLGVYGVADLLVYLPVVVIVARLLPAAGRGGDRVGKAATLLLWVIVMLAGAHGLVLVGSALTELTWGPPFDGLQDTVAVWESIVWMIAILAVAARVVWPGFLQSLRRGLSSPETVVAVAVVAVAILVWLATMLRVDRSWRPAITEPFTRDTLPIVLGGVAGLGVVAVFAGVTVRVWKVARWKKPRRSREIGVALLTGGVLLAVASPMQYAAYVLRREETIHWLSGDQGFWGENPEELARNALAYPRWMVDLVATPLWMLVALAVLALLCRLTRSRRQPADEVRCLIWWLGVFFFVLVAVWWPDWYAGLWFPLAALVTFGTLLGFLWIGKSRTVLAQRSGAGADFKKDRNLLIEEARSYGDLETRGRQLETRWSGGDIELKRLAYNAERQELHTRIGRSRERVGLKDDQLAPTPLDAYLASGPEATAWCNGVVAAQQAIIPALLATAYALAVSWRHGGWHTTLSGWFGPTQLFFLDTAGELFFWVGIAFVLGFFWRELPGARGYLKPWPLIAAYSLGAGAHYLVTRLLGQSSPQGQLTRIMLMIMFLAVVAVLMDWRALKALRDAWTPRLGPLITVYGLRPTGSTIAFVLAQAVAAFTLWQQLRTGTGITPPPGGSGAGPSR
jgi:Family of unknown function (DUF6185)